MDELVTERLVIRSFVPEDWKDLNDYLSDPEVIRFEPYHVFNIEKCQEEAIRRSSQEFFRAVCLKSTNKLIGTIYFEQTEPKVYSTWELGYVFNSKYQGNGYATEGCKAILQHAFYEFHARRIVAMCNTMNKASWKLLERLNFRKEGHFLKQSFFKRDEKGNPIWQDVFEYAILSEEWFGVRWN
jgi:ribosomal-protein-alanine N-acetyltransferase